MPSVSSMALVEVNNKRSADTGLKRNLRTKGARQTYACNLSNWFYKQKQTSKNEWKNCKRTKTFSCELQLSLQKPAGGQLISGAGPRIKNYCILNGRRKRHDQRFVHLGMKQVILSLRNKWSYLYCVAIMFTENDMRFNKKNQPKASSIMFSVKTSEIYHGCK